MEPIYNTFLSPAIYGIPFRFKDEDLKVDMPERYIINENATILFWKNGEKTVVRKCEEDEFNPRLAFLIAFFQHYCGMSKNKANKYLAGLEVEKKEEKEQYKPKHMKEEFEIGDIVKEKRFGRGRIIDIPGNSVITVEFDKEDKQRLHSAMGKGKINHCWNCDLKDLTKEKK